MPGKKLRRAPDQETVRTRHDQSPYSLHGRPCNLLGMGRCVGARRLCRVCTAAVSEGVRPLRQPRMSSPPSVHSTLLD